MANEIDENNDGGSAEAEAVVLEALKESARYLALKHPDPAVRVVANKKVLEFEQEVAA